MDELALPDEFVAYLKDKRPWTYNADDCEVGATALNELSDLGVETFRLQTYATPLEEQDPHAGDEHTGFYLVPVVSLIKTCEHYLPQYLLVWLPQEGVFGSGDEEHGHLLTFPRASWTEIAARPIPFLEAQFLPESGVSEYLRPWPKYTYAPMAEG